MTDSKTTPPETVPEPVVAALRESTDSELKEIIHYAHQLLQRRPTLTDEIEARDDETLLSRVDYDEYTVVTIERPEESGWARGPFVYRISREAPDDDPDGRYRWHYLGHVNPDSAGG